MNLVTFTKELIYKSQNPMIPAEYTGFHLVSPEYSPHETEIKYYPNNLSENIFAILWNIHHSSKITATALPSTRPFTYEQSFIPGTRTQMHTHEYLELFYVVEGEYRQNILGQQFTFHKGELCLIDKNCRHQEILDGNSSTILFFGIKDVIFNEIMTYFRNTERISSFLNMALLEQKNLQQYLHFRPKTIHTASIDHSVSQLLQEIMEHDLASPFILQGLLLRIFKILGNDYDFSLAKKSHKRTNWRLFEEITEYMNLHLADISLTQLVEEFHFHEDYFNRLLKRQIGMTYTEYLQMLRLRKAEELLLNTNDTIDQIAEAIGYHNKGYFYKIFTERHQLTPAQFRKKI